MNGNEKDYMDILRKAMMGEQEITQVPMRPEDQIDSVGNEPVEQPLKSAVTDTELSQVNAEAKSPNMMTKPELMQKEAKEQADGTIEGQIQEEQLAKEAKQEDPTLQQYKQAIEKYKAKLAEPKKEYGVGDALPDILSGLYNIGVRAKGGVLPEMQMPNTIGKKKAADKESRKEGLSGLEKLQSAYKNYLATEKSLQKDSGMTPAEKLRLQLSRERLEETREDRKRKAEQYERSMGRREEEDKLKKVADISKRMEKSGIVERTRAMKDIENFLSDKYDSTLENPKKDIDIEGIGVMGGFRPDFLTDEEDVSFRQNVQGLANQLLKARSGAAVTDQEYRRFLKEVGSGNFSTEQNLMDGLKKMKRDIADQTANITQSYGKDVRKEYEDATGLNLYQGGKADKAQKRDSKIEDYAKKYNLDYNKAERILRARGYNG